MMPEQGKLCAWIADFWEPKYRWLSERFLKRSSSKPPSATSGPPARTRIPDGYDCYDHHTRSRDQSSSSRAATPSGV